MSKINKVTLHSFLILSFLFNSNKALATNSQYRLPLSFKKTTISNKTSKQDTFNLATFFSIKTKEINPLIGRVKRMFGLENYTNLRTYNYGLVLLNPYYHIPNASDLMEVVRSDANYVGCLPKELSHDEAIALLKKEVKPYLLYELKQEMNSDFYLIHSKEIRHFTINDRLRGNMVLASVDNGRMPYYPSLSSLVADTIFAI